MLSTTVVIVSFNSRDCLPLALDSVRRSTIAAQIVVVDNDSTDGSAAYVEADWPDVVLIRSSTNVGYAAACNLGVKASRGDNILFMNPDVRLDPDCLEHLATALASRPGACGPVIRLGDGGDKKEFGSVVDLLLMPVSLSQPGRPLFVTGACLATNRDVFQAIGGLDERMFLFNEDIEYCWQALRCGFDVYTVDHASCAHLGGVSIPGGYYRHGNVETSRLRLVERERGTTALALACVPTPWLPLFVLLALFRTSMIAIGLVAMGYAGIAKDVVATIGWNVSRAQGTLVRRRNPFVSKVGCKEAFGRVRRSVVMFDTLRRVGLPKIVG